MQYTVDLKWVPGKTHHAADALSRSPMWDTMKEDEDPMSEINKCLKTFSSHFYARDDMKLNNLFEAANDEEYKEIVAAFQQEACLTDLPAHHPARELKDVWDSVSLIDDQPGALLVLDDSKIVIPRSA